MPLPSNNNPEHWYNRAAAMRLLAEEMKAIETKSTMLRLADDYDRLADRAAKPRRRNNEATEGN
jgi:hypothetical protein